MQIGKLSLSILVLILSVSSTMNSVASASETAAVDLGALEFLKQQNNHEAFEGVAEAHRTRIWTPSPAVKSQVAVLIVHGLYSSPAFLQGVQNNFALQGMNGVNLLLAGHWRSPPNSLNDVSYKDWIEDFENGYRIASGLGEKVLVVGHSTGALLAVRKALKKPANLMGLILAAPALVLSNKASFFVNFGNNSFFSANRFCRVGEEMNFVCRVLDQLVPGLNYLVQEGGYYSLPAGKQVYELQERIYKDHRKQVSYKDDRGYEESMHMSLWKIYSLIHVPVLMVSAEEDLVVSNSFNRKWIRDLDVPYRHIHYPKETGLIHETLLTSKQDALKVLPEGYNPYFSDLMSEIGRFFEILD